MTPPRRFRRADWLDLGLEAVAEAGPSGLTIDALTARAGKTRGSFYAHFATMADYHEALAGHWRDVHTSRLIAQAVARPEPAERLDNLNRLAFHLDPRIEQGMRRLAASEASVAAVCARVDQERIDFLAGEYARLDRFTVEQAGHLARIEYAAFVGLQQTEPGNTPAELMRLYQTFLAMTGRG